MNEPDYGEFFGYLDRFEFRPGERIDVRLHSPVHPARIDVVELRGADERVPSMAPEEVPVEAIEEQTAPATTQAFRRGSRMHVDVLDEVLAATRIRLDVWLYPTLDNVGRTQIIASTRDERDRGGFLLMLAEGRTQLKLGGGATEWICELRQSLPARVWTQLLVDIDPSNGLLSLVARPDRLPPVEARRSFEPEARILMGHACSLTFGGGLGGERPFTGKIASPQLAIAGPGEDLRVLAAWSPALEAHTQCVRDPIGGHDGRLIGGPTRSVTGPTWRGREVDPRMAPSEYDAIHFHEDDFDDAGWSSVASIELPIDIASGVYAVRCQADGGADRIPFFVLPPRRGCVSAVNPSTVSRPAVAFLAPTFSYLAYGNAMVGERIDYVGFGISGREMGPSVRDLQLARHPEYGGSLYDIHVDGSGRCYSSLKRPLFSFRPEWRSAVQQAPRHLSADLYITGWLREIGQAHDVVTDGALDAEGAELLAPYRVLITGSHPEYVSAPMLDAIESFLEDGGRLMYLGGNGFYWVTSVDPERRHLIEVRRGNSGTRTWDSSPGETHHSTTGEQGGLWRHRGRAPNRLLGVGMASQGWDEKAPGYERTEASYGSDLSWMFAGIEGKRFGEEGLVMGGAAGDEVDRCDPLLGSPPTAVVVASSTGHSHYYKLALEDQLMSMDHIGGDEQAGVRSDVTLVPYIGGGGVFSVGSITWAGAMAFADYENDVAKLTTNVLHRFIDPRPLDLSPRERL